MIISNSSSFVSGLQATSNVQPQQNNRNADPDGDGDGGGHVRRAHGGGGQVQQALMQALQTLGLAAPQSTTSSPSTGQSPTSGDSDGDSDGSTSASSAVKQDMRQFMHALFQALKSESASAPAAAGSTSADPKSNFAAKLSALITQVSSGSAPTDLQSAFAKLAADAQQANPATNGAAATGASTSGTTPQQTLQSLLTLMQQDLGYGAASSSTVAGNVISTQV